MSQEITPSQSPDQNKDVRVTVNNDDQYIEEISLGTELLERNELIPKADKFEKYRTEKKALSQLTTLE